MTIKDIYIKAGISGVFAAAVFLFFCCVYPHHLHFQEQLQLFRFSADYFTDALALPGGVADWIGEFFTQFCLYSGLGAALIAGLLLALQLLGWKLMDTKNLVLYPLSFLPSVAFFLFLCDENALLSGLCAIILSAITAILLCKIKNNWLHYVALVIAAPVMFWLMGSLSLVMIFCVLVTDLFDKERSVLQTISAFALATAIWFVVPLIASSHISYSLSDILGGIHYHRVRHATPLLAWVSAVLVPVVAILPRIVPSTIKNSKVYVAATFVAVLAIQIGVSFLFVDMQKEDTFKYDYLVRTGQWKDILKCAVKDNPRSPIPVECTNLALLKTGRLANDMFKYYQNGPSGLLPDFNLDHLSPIPTGEVYYHLGMVNAAQTYFFEAQEAIPDFRKSARLYKNLAKTNLINGDYEVARKYVNALKQTLFYRGWAKQTEALLDDPTKILADKEYAWYMGVRMKTRDFLFSSADMDSMLGLLFMENRSNKAPLQYLLAWCMLKKDLPRFFECISLLESGYEAKSYQEAFLMYWGATHDNLSSLPGFVSKETTSRFAKFIKDMRGGKDEAYMENHYGDTYFFYHYFRFK